MRMTRSVSVLKKTQTAVSKARSLVAWLVLALEQWSHRVRGVGLESPSVPWEVLCSVVRLMGAECLVADVLLGDFLLSRSAIS